MTARATFATPRTTMPTHVKLVGHYEQRVRNGVNVGFFGLRFALGDGATVEVPTLFKPISDRLAVAPVVEVVDNVLRFNLASWVPMRYGPDGVLFALAFTDSDVATRVAFALDADPHANWRWPAADATTWCQLHADRLDLRF